MWLWSYKATVINGSVIFTLKTDIKTIKNGPTQAWLIDFWQVGWKYNEEFFQRIILVEFNKHKEGRKKGTLSHKIFFKATQNGL